jgi:hypothetical protein
MTDTIQTVQTPTADQLIRANAWKQFVTLQHDNLLYLYTQFVPQELQQKVSFEDWIHFAFEQTSNHGLQLYRTG